MHAQMPLLLLALLTPAAAQTQVRKPVTSPREAKAIAERHTGGIAVSARCIYLNGATGGWEVDVHMPGEDRGWRCIIDNDTHQVHTKTRIPNPKLPKRRHLGKPGLLRGQRV